MNAAARQSGQVVGGKYQLERVLGAGGMGEVWSARHTSLQTSVALKFLKGSSASEPETRSRFELEARVTAQLKTRLAVQVFDYGVADHGEPFLVMELLEGESLAARLHRFGRFAPNNAVHLLGQAARALDKAHALGIVHRDFKPGNIFIVVDEDYREQVKVMDFGLAKIMGELDAPQGSAASLDDTNTSSFTRTGALLGTPSYMSPEQIAGNAEIGPATDVWAFGIVAFECLTGQVPFQGQRLSELFDAVRTRRALKGSALAPELGADFDAWFEKACAQEAAQRFSTPVVAFNELAKALKLAHASLPELQAVDLSSGPYVNPMPGLVTPSPSRPQSGSGPMSSAEEGFEPTLKRGMTPHPSMAKPDSVTLKGTPGEGKPKGKLPVAALGIGGAIAVVAVAGLIVGAKAKSGGDEDVGAVQVQGASVKYDHGKAEVSAGQVPPPSAAAPTQPPEPPPPPAAPRDALLPPIQGTDKEPLPGIGGPELPDHPGPLPGALPMRPPPPPPPMKAGPPPAPARPHRQAVPPPTAAPTAAQKVPAPAPPEPAPAKPNEPKQKKWRTTDTMDDGL